jgi:hypothetical protein
MNWFLLVCALLIGIFVLFMPYIVYRFQADVNQTAISEESQEAFNFSTEFWNGLAAVLGPVALAVIVVSLFGYIGYQFLKG